MIVIGGLRAPSVSGCEWRRRFEFLPESSRFFASIASLPLSPPPFLSLSLSLSETQTHSEYEKIGSDGF